MSATVARVLNLQTILALRSRVLDDETSYGDAHIADELADEMAAA